MQKIHKTTIDEKKYQEEVFKILFVKAIDNQIHLEILVETAAICGKTRFISRECELDCRSGDWRELEGSDLVGSIVEIAQRGSIDKFFNCFQ